MQRFTGSKHVRHRTTFKVSSRVKRVNNRQQRETGGWHTTQIFKPGILWSQGMFLRPLGQHDNAGCFSYLFDSNGQYNHLTD